MPLTLLEMAKRSADRGQTFDAEVAMQFAASAPLLQVMPFQDIGNNAYAYNRQETLPGVGFRGFNEGYSESTGVVNPQVETLKIGGGDLDVDVQMVSGPNDPERRVEEQQKIRALALSIQKTIIKGDADANPKEFDGLQKRATGTQVIDAGSSSGGDALSLSKLTRVRKLTRMPTHWIMSREMAARIEDSAYNTGVGGYVNQTIDAFRQPITTFAGLPILEMEEDEAANDILPFAEANPGGGTAASTSIYCVSLRPSMFFGLQKSAIQARDLGELQTKPAFRSRVEWMCGIAIKDGRSVTRLRGIKDAAVVV